MSTPGDIVMDAAAVKAGLQTMGQDLAAQITPQDDRWCLVGIQKGGVPVAERLAAHLAQAKNLQIPVGTVEVALYRDDAATALPKPQIGASHIPFEVNGVNLVLVDDVLQTGRTVRAAIDCVLDYGRPRRIWLAVLCDRGQRELPIAPDFIGCSVEVPRGALLEAQFDTGRPSVVMLNRGKL